jgi:hypothetical protein
MFHRQAATTTPPTPRMPESKKKKKYKECTFAEMSYMSTQFRKLHREVPHFQQRTPPNQSTKGKRN